VKCPKCGNRELVFGGAAELVTWACPAALGGCGHNWPYLHPRVRRAFAAYERALKKALDAGAEDGYEARLNLRDRAYTLALHARKARARAEGKEKP